MLCCCCKFAVWQRQDWDLSVSPFDDMEYITSAAFCVSVSRATLVGASGMQSESSITVVQFACKSQILRTIAAFVKKLAELQRTERFLIAIVHHCPLFNRYFQRPFTLVKLRWKCRYLHCLFCIATLYFFSALRSFQWKMPRGYCIEEGSTFGLEFDRGSALETWNFGGHFVEHVFRLWSLTQISYVCWSHRLAWFCFARSRVDRDVASRVWNHDRFARLQE